MGSPSECARINCQAFLNYSFTNLVPKGDGTLEGFSTWWNPLSKASKICSDLIAPSKFRELERIVKSTLCFIDRELEVLPGRCPLFFYVDTLVQPGKLTLVTYEAVAYRVSTSKTLAGNAEIRELALTILSKYKEHRFGFGKDSRWTQLKESLIDDVGREFKLFYDPKESRVDGFPQDPFNDAGMKAYLNEKLKKIKKVYKCEEGSE